VIGLWTISVSSPENLSKPGRGEAKEVVFRGRGRSVIGHSGLKTDLEGLQRSVSTLVPQPHHREEFKTLLGPFLAVYARRSEIHSSIQAITPARNDTLMLISHACHRDRGQGVICHDKKARAVNANAGPIRDAEMVTARPK
jgi:hypothetical protein